MTRTFKVIFFVSLLNRNNLLRTSGFNFCLNSRRGNFDEGAVLLHSGTEEKFSATKNLAKSGTAQSQKSYEKIKLIRAHGECLGVQRR